jgi:hypothetical protein
MADTKPYTQTDQVIRVPIPQDLTAEQIAAIEALPGFLGYLD